MCRYTFHKEGGGRFEHVTGNSVQLSCSMADFLSNFLATSKIFGGGRDAANVHRRSVYIIFAGAIGASAMVETTRYCWLTFRDNALKEMMLQAGLAKDLQFSLSRQ